MKVLNLYAGIGGNRKEWEDAEVTAIEYNKEIADIYKQLHPNDIVIVTDAHEYLVKNWMNFDFIWSSPPCQSHSKVRMMASKSGSYDAIMPDMRLWQEIIFLQNFAKKWWVVENVFPYYDPLIKPSFKLGRHYFWTNIDLMSNIFLYDEIQAIKGDNLSHNERGTSSKGFFDLSKYKIEHRKDQIIRNCVDPVIGNLIYKAIKT